MEKRIALVAHDNMKQELAEWVDWNWEILVNHHLVCTGTTGKIVSKTLTNRHNGENAHFDITFLK
ncbi:MAG: methylglyoxal synthase, partial [Rikenellaceae bacterium]